jgi:hypothetical protein
MSDSVPATINGNEPTALSEDEYVVTAGDVANVGNGSTNAGARKLTDMFKELRTLKTGNPAQPPAVNTGGLASALA